MYRQNMNNSNYVSTKVFSFLYKRLPLWQNPMAILSLSFCLSMNVFMTLLFPRVCFTEYAILVLHWQDFVVLSVFFHYHEDLTVLSLAASFFFSALRSWLCLRTALVLLNLSFAFWTSYIKISILLRVWGFFVNIFSNNLTLFKILIPSRASVMPKIALLFGCKVSLDFVHLSSFHTHFFSNSIFSSSIATSSWILSICSIFILMGGMKFLIQFSEKSQELLWGFNCPIAVKFPC